MLLNGRPAILIVDDKDANLAAMRVMLKDLDAELVMASSGPEALAKTLDREFAFMLLDVRMPGMDGFEVARILKQDRDGRRLPIVFVTADAYMDTAVVEGYESGGFDYIVKPVDPRVLLGKSRILLQLYRFQKEAIGRTELRYETLFNGTSDLVVVCEEVCSNGHEAGLRIVEANAAFERFAGIGARDARGQLLDSAFADLDSVFIHDCVSVARGAPPLETIRLRLFGTSFFHASVHSPAPGYAAVILSDITKIVEAEQRAQQLLEDKVLLLQEVHHRVKNNLQMIVSLLELQSNSLDDPILTRMLRSVQNRVHAIASVHEQLCITRSTQCVPLSSHMESLASYFSSTDSLWPFELLFDLQIDPDIALVLDVAVPVALIVQELISNSLKHSGKEGGVLTIAISAAIDREGRCVLRVRDNGKGETPDRPPSKGTGIGRILIEGLSEQVKGTVSTVTEKGYEVTLTFPLSGAGRTIGPNGGLSTL